MADLPCFWPPDWVSDTRNYAITDARGNIGLLDYVKEGVYEPHFYFEDRGARALSTAKAMLQWVFENTAATELRGKTPILQKGAWWITRRVGFVPCGIEASEWGPLRLSYMTRELWEQKMQMEPSSQSVLTDSYGKLGDVRHGSLSGFALTTPYSCDGSVKATLKETGQVSVVNSGGEEIGI